MLPTKFVDLGHQKKCSHQGPKPKMSGKKYRDSRKRMGGKGKKKTAGLALWRKRQEEEKQKVHERKWEGEVLRKQAASTRDRGHKNLAKLLNAHQPTNEGQLVRKQALVTLYGGMVSAPASSDSLLLRAVADAYKGKWEEVRSLRGMGGSRLPAATIF